MAGLFDDVPLATKTRQPAGAVGLFDDVPAAPAPKGFTGGWGDRIARGAKDIYAGAVEGGSQIVHGAGLLLDEYANAANAEGAATGYITTPTGGRMIVPEATRPELKRLADANVRTVSPIVDPAAAAMRSHATRVAPANPSGTDNFLRMGGGFVAPLAAGPLMPLTFAAQGAATSYDEAKAKGADEATARRASLMNAGVQGGVGMIPFEKVAAPILRFGTKRLGDSIGGRLAAGVIDRSAGGGAMGGGMALGENVVAQQTYEPDRPLGQGVAESAATMAVAGPVMHAFLKTPAGAKVLWRYLRGKGVDPATAPAPEQLHPEDLAEIAQDPEVQAILKASGVAPGVTPPEAQTPPRAPARPPRVDAQGRPIVNMADVVAQRLQARTARAQAGTIAQTVSAARAETVAADKARSTATTPEAVEAANVRFDAAKAAQQVAEEDFARLSKTVVGDRPLDERTPLKAKTAAQLRPQGTSKEDFVSGEPDLTALRRGFVGADMGEAGQPGYVDPATLPLADRPTPPSAIVVDSAGTAQPAEVQPRYALPGQPTEQVRPITTGTSRGRDLRAGRNLPVPTQPGTPRMSDVEVAQAQRQAGPTGGGADQISDVRGRTPLPSRSAKQITGEVTPGRPLGEAPADTLRVPEGRQPQSRDQLAEQQRAAEAFRLQELQRARAGAGIRDVQPGTATPEGAVQGDRQAGTERGPQPQEVLLDQGFPVRILQHGNRGAVQVERYDPRTGKALEGKDGEPYVTTARSLTSKTYVSDPRRAQDFGKRDQPERMAPEEPRMAGPGKPRREPTKTYQTTEPDPNVDFPGAGTEGRSPNPPQPEGPGPWPEEPYAQTAHRARTEEELRRQEERRQRENAREEQDRTNRARRGEGTSGTSTNEPKGKDAEGRWHVDENGYVMSKGGGPIVFGDHKQAANWIIKVGHAESPDQIFERAAHPTKSKATGGRFGARQELVTVIETGRRAKTAEEEAPASEPNPAAGAGEASGTEGKAAPEAEPRGLPAPAAAKAEPPPEAKPERPGRDAESPAARAYWDAYEAADLQGLDAAARRAAPGPAQKKARAALDRALKPILALRKAYDDELAANRNKIPDATDADKARYAAEQATDSPENRAAMQKVVDGWRELDEGMAKVLERKPHGPVTDKALAFQQEKLADAQRKAGGDVPPVDERDMWTLEHVVDGSSGVADAKAFRADPTTPAKAKALMDRVEARIRAIVTQLNEMGVRVNEAHMQDATTNMGKTAKALRSELSSLTGLSSRYIKQSMAVRKGYQRGSADKVLESRQALEAVLAGKEAPVSRYPAETDDPLDRLEAEAQREKGPTPAQKVEVDPKQARRDRDMERKYEKADQAPDDPERPAKLAEVVDEHMEIRPGHDPVSNRWFKDDAAASAAARKVLADAYGGAEHVQTGVQFGLEMAQENHGSRWGKRWTLKDHDGFEKGAESGKDGFVGLGEAPAAKAKAEPAERTNLDRYEAGEIKHADLTPAEREIVKQRRLDENFEALKKDEPDLTREQFDARVSGGMNTFKSFLGREDPGAPATKAEPEPEGLDPARMSREGYISAKENQAESRVKFDADKRSPSRDPRHKGMTNAQVARERARRDAGREHFEAVEAAVKAGKPVAEVAKYAKHQTFEEYAKQARARGDKGSEESLRADYREARGETIGQHETREEAIDAAREALGKDAKQGKYGEGDFSIGARNDGSWSWYKTVKPEPAPAAEAKPEPAAPTKDFHTARGYRSREEAEQEAEIARKDPGLRDREIRVVEGKSGTWGVEIERTAEDLARQQKQDRELREKEHAAEAQANAAASGRAGNKAKEGVDALDREIAVKEKALKAAYTTKANNEIVREIRALRNERDRIARESVKAENHFTSEAPAGETPKDAKARILRDLDQVINRATELKANGQGDTMLTFRAETANGRVSTYTMAADPIGERDSRGRPLHPPSGGWEGLQKRLGASVDQGRSTVGRFGDKHDPVLHSRLTDTDKADLASHYGEKTYNRTAVQRFRGDVMTALKKGLDAVHQNIRHIVKKAGAAVLSLHLVFSPHAGEFREPPRPAAAERSAPRPREEIPVIPAERRSAQASQRSGGRRRDGRGDDNRPPPQGPAPKPMTPEQTKRFLNMPDARRAVPDSVKMRQDAANTIRIFKDAGTNAKEFAGAARKLYDFVLSSNGQAMRLMARSIQKQHPEAAAALHKMADMLATDPGSGRVIGETWERAVQGRTGEMTSRARSILGEDTTPDMDKQVVDVLAGRARAIPGSHIDRIARDIRGLLDDQWTYMRRKGLEPGYVREGYFPRVVDLAKVKTPEQQEAFKQAATKLYRDMGFTGMQQGLEPGVRRTEAEQHAINWLDRIKGVNDSAYGANMPHTDATKGRVLPKSADVTLKDFLQDDLRGVLGDYFHSTSRAAEATSRFGVRGEKIAELRNTLRSALSDTDVKRVTQMIESATGHMFAGKMDSPIGSDLVSIWGALTFLPRATWSSLAEGAAIGVKAHDWRKGVEGIADSFRELTPLRQKDDARAVSEFLGVVGDAMNDMFMSARAGVDPKTKALRHLTSKFFRANLLTQVTEAQRVAAVRIGRAMIGQLTREVATGHARAKSAQLILNDLGVDEATAKGLHSLLNGRKHLDLAQLSGHSPEIEAYKTAIRRFADESIQNPSMADRPALANHPFTRAAYAIQSFTYSNTKNILAPTFKATTRALDPSNDLTPQDRLRMLNPVIALAVLSAAQYGVSQLRDKVTNRQAASERTPEQKTVTDMSRMSLFGNYDAIANALAQGGRYEKTPLNALAGPYLGGLAEDATRMAAAAPGAQGNNPLTNTAEHRGVKAAHHAIIAPGVAAGISLLPEGSPILRAVLYAAMQKASAPESGKQLADLIAGERTDPPRQYRPR